MAPRFQCEWLKLFGPTMSEGWRRELATSFRPGPGVWDLARARLRLKPFQGDIPTSTCLK